MSDGFYETNEIKNSTYTSEIDDANKPDNGALSWLIADLRESLESMMKSHNEDLDGVNGWEIGLALGRLKALELYILKNNKIKE